MEPRITAPLQLLTFLVYDYATDEDCKHDRREYQEGTIHGSLLLFVPLIQTLRFLPLSLVRYGRPFQIVRPPAHGA